jgi:hypothetical protein
MLLFQVLTKNRIDASLRFPENQFALVIPAQSGNPAPPGDVAPACAGAQGWGEFIGRADIRVPGTAKSARGFAQRAGYQGQTYIPDNHQGRIVSTVFLGSRHRAVDEGPPYVVRRILP